MKSKYRLTNLTKELLFIFVITLVVTIPISLISGYSFQQYIFYFMLSGSFNFVLSRILNWGK